MRSSTTTPPVEEVARLSRWPKVLGIFSIIYATGGLLCATGITLSPVLQGFFNRLAGIDVEVPLALKVTNLCSGLVLLALGGMLFTAGVGMAGRKRPSVVWARRWAVGRLLLLVVGMLITVLTMPLQMELQRQVIDAQNDLMRESDMLDRLVNVDDAGLWRRVVIPVAIASAVLAIYPTCLGLFLGRRAVIEEVKTWE